jgi:hypothetical protein
MATNVQGTNARFYETQQVHYLRKRITFAIENTEIVIGTIPAGASVIGGGVHVVTAFNDGTADTLDVGFKDGSSTDDPNGYATVLDLTAIGFIELDELAAVTNIQQTVDTVVTCIYNGTDNDADEGIADVIITFVVDNDN